MEDPAGDRTTFAYDLDNQLVQVEDAAGAVTTYTYNALQQRVGRDVDGDVTHFLCDGVNLRQESQAGVVEADYTVAPQPEPQPYGDLVSQHRDTESSFYHFDALGSTRALTDAGETVTDEATYRAFGETTASSGTTANPFGWVGRPGYYRDKETGLADLRRRKYDPATGTFTTEDPLGFQAESDFYRYAGNDPATKTDPSGYEEPWPGLQSGPSATADEIKQALGKLPPDESHALRAKLAGNSPGSKPTSAPASAKPKSTADGLDEFLDLLQRVGQVRARFYEGAVIGFVKDGLYEDVVSIASLPGQIWKQLVYEYQNFSPMAAAASGFNPLIYYSTKVALQFAYSAPQTGELLSRQFKGLDADTVVRLFAGDLEGLEDQVSPELLLFARVVHEYAHDLLDTAQRELENLSPEKVAEGMGRIYGFLIYTAAGMLLSAGAAAALKEARIVALVQRLKQLPGLKSPAAQKAIDKLFEALRLLKPRKPATLDPSDPPVRTAPRLTAKRVEEATDIADDLFVEAAPSSVLSKLDDGIPVSVPRTTAGRNLLELAPESQGFRQLQARFENIPESMWADFPVGVPRPAGPINLLEGATYDAARQAANRINRKLSRGFGMGSADFEIHEIVPVKFGGSPTDLANKVGLHEKLHSHATTWFNRLQRLLEGGE